MGMKF